MNEQLLLLDINHLKQHGAYFTAREISQQPDLWKKIWEKIEHQKDALWAFLQQAYSMADNIILTGAGTSAYIGMSLSGIFFRNTGIHTRAVPTTDLVSHPYDYFHKDHIPLIISFARSGNSPESCAALELADKLSRGCYHLIITCNESGDLAAYKSGQSAYIFTLPPDSNDKSLAMTSSYTGMLLAGTIIAQASHDEGMSDQVKLLCQYGEHILQQYASLLYSIANQDFSRAVFLGNGALSGTATEAQLKLQELTNGKVICKNDTFLGFRHGPKAVIDEKSLVVYFFSQSDYVLNYERDLVTSMKKGNKALMEIGIMESHYAGVELDAVIVLSAGNSSLHEDLLPVVSIVPAQMLAFYKSLALGLQPDTPSLNGAISRVVQGVEIYPLTTGS